MEDIQLELRSFMCVMITTSALEWSPECVKGIWNGVELHQSVNVSGTHDFLMQYYYIEVLQLTLYILMLQIALIATAK